MGSLGRDLDRGGSHEASNEFNNRLAAELRELCCTRVAIVIAGEKRRRHVMVDKVSEKCDSAC